MDHRLEHRQVPGSTSGWSESHRVDLYAAGPGLALSLYVSARPHAQQATIIAVVLATNEPPLVVADEDVPLPPRGWEFRTSGLWADHICETPHDHWSYGLEAFGLALEDAAELLGRGHGDRVPVGWELEFEARGAPEAGRTSSGYSQTGIGHGILLSVDGQTELTAAARRWHWWGHEPAPSVRVPMTLSDDQACLNEVLVPDGDGYWHHQLLANGAAVEWVSTRAGVGTAALGTAT